MKRTVAPLLCLLLPAGALAGDIVIHAGRLIDGSGGAPRSQVSILIKDDKITAVQAGFASLAGAEAIDLSQATVLPGLIDAHKHMGNAPRRGRGAVAERGPRPENGKGICWPKRKVRVWPSGVETFTWRRSGSTTQNSWAPFSRQSFSLS